MKTTPSSSCTPLKRPPRAGSKRFGLAAQRAGSKLARRNDRPRVPAVVGEHCHCSHYETIPVYVIASETFILTFQTKGNAPCPDVILARLLKIASVRGHVVSPPMPLRAREPVPTGAEVEGTAVRKSARRGSLAEAARVVAVDSVRHPGRRL